MDGPGTSMRLGLIAGNGRFPFLVLEAARAQGHDVTIIAAREETFPELNEAAARLKSDIHWISLGQLGTCIKVLQRAGVTQAVMAGQVKHAKIFSSIRPDWRLFKVLAALPRKNTDSLIGAVQKVLADEGIELVDSTLLLKPLLAPAGVLTKRKPDPDERRDIEYGRRIAHALASVDIGQSVAIADRACVAVEAMEGTDAMLRRAASLVEGKRMTLVKSSSRRRHLLFDVPVIGPGTIAVMQETGTTSLAVDAGRTLMLDKDEMLAKANSAGVAIEAAEPAG